MPQHRAAGRLPLRIVGEHGAVEVLVSRLLSRQWRCILPPGDDASCVEIGGRYIVLKIDGAGISSLRAPWMSMYDVGWQSVAAAASDLAAKAAKPLAFLVSTGLHPDTSLQELEELVRGAADAAKAHGAWLAGGDTNSAPASGWVDVAAVGVSDNPIPVSGAKPGDAVYTTVGRVGVAGMAVDSIVRGTWRRYIERHPHIYTAFTRPIARLEFAELASQTPGCITASTDSSDGIAYSLWRLAKASNVQVHLESLPNPPPEVAEYAEENSIKVENLILYGGQEYEVLFTVKPDCTPKIERLARKLKLQIHKLGRIEPGPPKVTYKGEIVEERGWDNFLNTS